MRQCGFSLIEVLVTMLILAFGLLGVAGLLVGGVSNASSSEAFSKASLLAADMADRIRANPSEALSSNSKYRRLQYLDAAPVISASSTNAERDVKAWLDAIAAQLPQGGGRIIDAVTGGQRKYTIEVRWSNCLGTLSDADRTNCQIDASATFRNISVELRL
jgi:type IV pilus assembly protein PilV